MKYFAPEFNTVEIETNDVILASTGGNTGGNVYDDGTIGGLPEEEA
ncbi:MAG: hypothetical protein IJ039_00475 [Clostridia bacterium]|nr:hypothetical protein [Clostridia bacterium]